MQKAKSKQRRFVEAQERTRRRGRAVRAGKVMAKRSAGYGYRIRVRELSESELDRVRATGQALAMDPGVRPRRRDAE